MGGRALGALGPAHQAREYSRPTHGLYRDPRGPGGRGPARGSGAGQGARVARQGFRGQPGGQGAGQGFRGWQGGQHGTW